MSTPTLLSQHIVRRPQRIALLQHIAEQGSITRAAKSAGLSYKAAWDAIDELNNLAQNPLVERVVGGKGGGGARLSSEGERVLRLYPKVGPKVADRVWRAISDAPSAIEAARSDKVIEIVPRGAKDGLRELGRLFGRITTLSAPCESIQAILDETYQAYLVMNYPNAPARIEDLRRMAEFARRFESCETLLAEFALSGTIQSDDLVLEPDDDDVLVLSTIHQAKGLEWKAVFVIWLTEGRFPDPRSCTEVEGLEEERRLFYVAVTRAQRELNLVYPQMAAERSFQVFTRPSRFLQELDPSTFESTRVVEPEL